MKKTKRHAGGFTLVELLVVVLIIGMLTGIIAPRLIGQIGKSEVTAAAAQMDAITKALDAYRFDMGAYPSTSEGLATLVVAPASKTRWRGPYLKGELPRDPWGTAFSYSSPGPQGRDYEISSLGSDRLPGGVGDAADIFK